MNVAVLIFNGVELVDMNGPIDAFLHASGFVSQPYNVYTVAENTEIIVSESGTVTIVPSFSIGNCPDPDIVVIPGRLSKQGKPIPAPDAVLAWIKKMAGQQKMIMSVCIGFYSLAETGELDGRSATTHYLFINDVHANKKFKNITLVKNVRFVEDGNFVTTGGITSGIDGALHLIEKYNGPDIADQTADMMVYNRAAPMPQFTLLPPYYPPE